MKVNVTTYSVELTTQEVETITGALHELYKIVKESKDCSLTKYTRELRNNFASLVNRHYMGEDA